ncbi:hypothetical protein C8R48DRAFT_142547 [Suillus tomentosus]|nr:hypothetical protein C8R48DRAFT_142547 [Suillus tomentosus]
MDAQRFNPLRRTSMRLASLFKTRTSDSTPMRQGPCVKSEKTSTSDVRPDHEIVVDPVEGKDSDLKGPCPSPKDTCITRVTTPVDIHDSVDKVATRTITRSEPNPRGGAPIVSVTEIVYRRPPSPQSIPPPGFNDSAETVATGTIVQSDPNPRGGAPIVSRAQMMSRGVWSHSPCCTQMVFTGAVSRSLPTNASSPSQSPSPSASSRATPPLANEPVDVLTTRTVTCPDPRGGPPTVSRTQMVFRGVMSRSPSCSQMVFTGTISCPPACANTPSPARTNTPSPSQSSSPSASSLNRLNTSSASGSDADDLKVHKRKRHTLLAIVKERREKHKDDRAFKDITGNDFPAAGVRDST